MNIAVTLKGIEDITEKEVKGKKILDKRVEFRGKVKDFKSVDIIYELIKRFKFKDLDDLKEKISKIKFNFKEVVYVKCNREGTHKFSSQDISGIVAKILVKQGVNISFKDYKEVLYIDIFENNCLIGKLLKEGLSKRDYRVKLRGGSISACLAYSLLQISGWKKQNSLLDPFCKDGVILIESGLLGGKKLYGIDENTHSCDINSKMANVKVELTKDALDWLDTKFKKNEVDFIISSPPFESKRKSKNIIRKIYEEFFNQASYILNKKIVLLCPKKDLLVECSKDKFKLVHEREVYQGNFKMYILVFDAL